MYDIEVIPFTCTYPSNKDGCLATKRVQAIRDVLRCPLRLGTGSQQPNGNGHAHPTMSSNAAYPQPPIRSRTLLFLSYRDSSSTRLSRRPRYAPSQYTDEEHHRLISPEDNHTTIDFSPPPKWYPPSIAWYNSTNILVIRVDVSDEVEDILQATVTKSKVVLP